MRIIDELRWVAEHEEVDVEVSHVASEAAEAIRELVAALHEISESSYPTSTNKWDGADGYAFCKKVAKAALRSVE